MNGYTQVYNADCMDALATVPDGTVALVLTDPPYNIGKADWDCIPNYIDWCMCWLRECKRVLKPDGMLYLSHNDMRQLAPLITRIEDAKLYRLVSFCVWDKGHGYHTRSWLARNPDKKHAALRAWFPRCEYYIEFRGWTARGYHRNDAKHHNIWQRPLLQSREKTHPCEKPQDLLRRIIRVSCPPEGTVLDPFAGTFSTGLAALREGRAFIGIERDAGYYNAGKQRLAEFRARGMAYGL